jgi:hypothetical protein
MVIKNLFPIRGDIVGEESAGGEDYRERDLQG